MAKPATYLVGWGLVELTDHRMIAGKVGEQLVAGSTFLDVDVPDYGRVLVSPSAAYIVTPTTEQQARAAATAIAWGDQGT